MTDAYTLAGSYATAALMSAALPKEQRGTELDPLVEGLPDGYASAAQNAAVEIVAGAFDSPTGNKAFLRSVLRRWAMTHQESAPPEPQKPKTAHEFTIGFNVRTWTTFEAYDLTPEQVEMLESQTGEDLTAEVLDLLRWLSLYESGRMSKVSTESDDAPDPFYEGNNPSIVYFDEVEAN